MPFELDLEAIALEAQRKLFRDIMSKAIPCHGGNMLILDEDWRGYLKQLGLGDKDGKDK